MRLDELARHATDSLLADAPRDTAARLADLKRTRRSRSVTRVVATVVVAAAIAIGGWTVLRDDDAGTPEPIAPTHRNGALLIAGDTIRVVEDNGQSLQLPEKYLIDGNLAFTADGSELLYSNRDQRIEAIDVATGEIRVVEPCPSSTTCSLSPDGRWLAQPGDDGILLREVGGERTKLLETAGIRAEHVAWSADGKTLALASFSGIYSMSTSGTALRPLVEFAGARPVPGLVQWSPDGRTLAFVEARPLVRDQHGLRAERFVLRLVGPDGDGPRDLQELGTCYCVRHPGPSFAWAPDGTAIAAAPVTTRRGHVADVRSDGVHLITLDGRSQRIAGGPSGRLVWQPVPR